MVKRAESAIKIVIDDKRKGLTRLNQKVLEVGRVRSFWALVTHIPPGRQQAPNPADFESGTWKPGIAPHQGKRAVRHAHSDAGLGCRKKRRPCCNGADTGFNVTRHASAPTSDGSFIAREFDEASA